MNRSLPSSSRRIKLTYLITDLKVGGVPLHLYRLATRLPRERFDIRVIALSGEGPVGELLQQAGIAVEVCGARSVRQWGSLGRLWSRLIADPPDILHALLFHANIASRLVGPLAGIAPRRILNEIQTVEVERRWHLLLDGLTCRLCRSEVGNSPSVVEHLHRQAGIPRSRLRCEFGAVDARAIAAAQPVDRAALGIEPGERFLLWTGRLDPVKGFEEMLAAVRILKRSWKIKLFLVGEGPYRRTVDELIGRYDLQTEVILPGRRDDIPNLLRAADLFVFCSRTEGLPNSLLEAMAAGLPIVATDVAGCRDLIRHMVTGLLALPGDAECIAHRIDTLLRDPELAGRLGKGAHEWVLHNADLHTWSIRWQQFYERFLTEGSGGEIFRFAELLT
jgi:glycosyltransferase involved in cell wall biosynthesis